MKVLFGKLLRSALVPVFGVAAMGALLTGCGDATDPTAVGLDELKFSFGLRIVDQGNGTVRLSWNGVNNEEGFSGYNIYGAKGDELASYEGKAIKLLDDKGEPDTAAKELLKKMSYNGKDWETSTSGTNADGDFEAFPYYTAGTPPDVVAPSCMPAETSGAGKECKPVAADGGTHVFNGSTWIDMKGLKIGSNYCFTTLATLDSGKSVAQTTSEVRCIVPRSAVEVATATATKGSSFGIDLEALRVKCADTGGETCGTLDVGTVVTDGQAAGTAFLATCGATTSLALCLEYFSGKANFTAGGRAGIQDLGYYENGFDDLTLPAAPALSSFGELQNKDGYSVAGQSLPIEDKHVYAVAHGEGTGTEKFFYHLIYVSDIDTTVADSTSFKMQVRVSNKSL